eukprot:1800430-Alexandrium_andersonii.AAC.1
MRRGGHLCLRGAADAQLSLIVARWAGGRARGVAAARIRGAASTQHALIAAVRRCSVSGRLRGDARAASRPRRRRPPGGPSCRWH